jgi:putative transposase
MQNGYIESFNGKCRDECLNDHWFETLPQASFVIAAWRQDFNEVRPHSSCQRMPASKYAVLHRQRTEGKQSPRDSINLSAGLPAK